MYVIVRLLCDNTLEAIPTEWLTNANECYWPSHLRWTEKIVLQRQRCSENWPKYRIQILRHNVASYEEAVALVNNSSCSAEFVSSVDDRQRRKRKRSISPKDSSMSSSSELDDDALMNCTAELNSERRSPDNYQANGISAIKEEMPSHQSVPSCSISAQGNFAAVGCSTSNILQDHPTYEPRQRRLSFKRIVDSYTAFQERIFTMFEETKIRLESMEHTQTTMIKLLQSKLGLVVQDSPELTIQILPDLPHLPIDNDTGLLAVETFIADSENKQRLINHLGLIGGISQEDVIRRILNKTITNLYAANYSYFGKKHKRAFNELGLNNVILGTLRQHKDHSSITEREFQIVISNWLKCAPSRIRKKATSGCGLDEMALTSL